MIVRNESAWLRACLESVRPIVTEMIVVDTGSDDGTPAIASEFGATLLDFKWRDDFSAARNFGIAHAASDWILVLDADERIAPQDLRRFEALTYDPSACFQFIHRHYTDDYTVMNFTAVNGECAELELGQLGYFETRIVRLFPNRRGLEYRGNVHELVEPSIGCAPGMHIEQADIRIHHFGHSSAAAGRRNERSAYSALGEKKIAQSPDEWRAFYELGVAKSRAGAFSEAVRLFKRAIELNPAHLESNINLGQALWRTGAAEEAIKVLERSIVVGPNSPEPYCNLGVVHLLRGDFTAAEGLLRTALVKNPRHINAHYNLAQALNFQRRGSDAAAQLELLLSIAPGCTQAQTALGSIYIDMAQFDKAEAILKQAIGTDGSGLARRKLGELLEATGRAAGAAQLKGNSVTEKIGGIIITD